MDSKKMAENVLLYVLRNILKILHPFMPFITEEIWQHLPSNHEPLILATWPLYNDNLTFQDSVASIEYIKVAIKAIRNARAETNIVPSRKSKQIFVTKDERIKDYILKGKRYFMNLASADDIEILEDKTSLGKDNISVILDKCEVFLPLKDLIDFEKELERIEKEKEKLEGEIKRVKSKLTNEGFISKAPEKIILEEKEKQKKYEDMLEKVLERLESIKNIL